MAPILLIETRAEGNEEESELEDLAGKVSLLWCERNLCSRGLGTVYQFVLCHPYGQRFMSLVCSCMYT